ncbi:exonuclease/endonuclease/phosphatase family protein [Couchioplanes azureus]|uniref:hypothetical protein n=1 Tax=Couchioplanes caeruleus TaxID=56438 RepID=UPI00167165F9|nr:hypothetical protein [Couchioplanes caeruleus]GGQ77244.1 hypothetical protein GCM10010166_53990 [Couchioplanes caeruleus subsp. azureus]
MRQHNPGGGSLVMALQGTGPLTGLSDVATASTPVTTVGGREVFTYRTGTLTVDEVSYRVHWPLAGGNRPTGLALVLPAAQPTDGFMVVPHPEGDGSRPAFGVRISGTWLFTLHATAGGRDAPALLRVIADAAGEAPWRAVGTFDVNPRAWNDPRHARFVLPVGAAVQASGHFTHVTGSGNAREIDYGVASSATAAQPFAAPWRPSPAGNHAPVIFPATTAPDDDQPGQPRPEPSTPAPCLDPIPLPRPEPSAGPMVPPRPDPSAGPIILPGPDQPSTAPPSASTQDGGDDSGSPPRDCTPTASPQSPRP